jgi:hypothetical protein
MNAIWNWMLSFERMMAASAFAEAGQWKFARTLMDENRTAARKQARARVDNQVDNRPQMRV